MPRVYLKRDSLKIQDCLLESIGWLLRERGHKALSGQQIARVAGVGKQYIKSIFGGREELVRAYLMQNEFWLPRLDEVRSEVLPVGEGVLRLFIELLQDQFRYFLGNVEMRKFILWQLTDGDELMRSIHELREAKGEEIMRLAEDHFRGTGIDLHWVIGFALTSGYFYGLHADTGNGPVCGRDVRRLEDVEGALRTIGQMLELFWWAAEQNRSGNLDREFFKWTAVDVELKT